MRPHTEVLTPEQKEALIQLGLYLCPRGWYLAGGTALALYFGHRKSVDLDWFLPEDTYEPDALASALRKSGVALKVSGIARGTVHGQVEGVKVSLFAYPYGLLQPLVDWDELNLRAASLDDLACMKLSAVVQRGSRKDFVDVWALLRQHRPLGELLDLYRRKFEVEDVGAVLYSLTYFADAEREPMPAMLWDVNWQQIKAEIAEEVRRFTTEERS